MCFCLKAVNVSQTLFFWSDDWPGHCCSSDWRLHWCLDASFDWDTEPVSEAVGKLHGDRRLSRGAVYLERLRKWGCFHHTSFTRLHTVEHPYSQSEAGAAGWLLYNSWKFGWDAEGLRQVCNVTSNHLTVQQPLVTWKRRKYHQIWGKRPADTT